SALPQNSAPLFSISYTLQILGLSKDYPATPLESALPRNQTWPSATPIESTPFFEILQFCTKSTPVTPAFTTLTKHMPCNPIRMNTSTRHHATPALSSHLTVLYSVSYMNPTPRRSRTERLADICKHFVTLRCALLTTMRCWTFQCWT